MQINKSRVELRRLDFAGKKLLYLNVMWKYLGQASFPLSERQYLEHLVRARASGITRRNTGRVDLIAADKDSISLIFIHVTSKPL